MNIVESASPPRRIEPNPRYSSLPEPVETTRGVIASKLVVALMKIGRIRVLTDSEMASIPDRS